MKPLERWRPVPGYVGCYEVSDQGRVRSVDRVITRRNGMRYRARGRVLRPALHRPWVRAVTLARCGHFRHDQRQALPRPQQNLPAN